ncbi:LysM domain-containing protein [Isoptericola sp. NPDC057559]|uniref:LysM domain-containing protein n=1 Tax=Isoptericola sp. NPDC057559 TaxID=3346168 RepID=UPI00369BA8DA
MSRYDGVPTTTFEVTTAAGERRSVGYVRRRFPPPPSDATTLARRTVAPGDRLDLLSFTLTGDPLGFWRICDANAALDPDDLVDDEAVGTVVVVPLPGVPGVPGASGAGVPR